MSDEEKQKIEDSIVDQDEPKTPIEDDKESEEPAESDISGKQSDTPKESEEPVSAKEQKTSRFTAFMRSIREHKIRTASGIVVLLALVGTGIYFTDARFVAMNLFAAADAEVIVFDEKTQQPVPEAKVIIGGKSVQTDKGGRARVSDLAFGRAPVVVSKFAYANKNEQVLIDKNGSTHRFALKPTGTPVTVTVHNAISGSPIKGAKVSFGKSDAVSNDKGVVSLSIPPQQDPDAVIAISADGYNGTKSEIEIAQVKTNEVKLTPAGKIFFLSKRTGVIDVMKSNLDGTDPEVVVKGTGREVDRETVLLASRDWKYLALQAKRDSPKAALYLIDSATGKLTNIDEGEDIIFTPVGWHDHNFVYQVTRLNKLSWEPGQNALKAYNAASGKLTTLDETAGEGNQFSHASQYFSSVYILKDGLSYAKNWNSYFAGPRENEVVSVRSDGSQKKTVQKFGEEATYGITSRLYEPQAVYYALHSQKGRVYYEFEDGTLKRQDITDANFDNAFYPTFLISPSGNKTFWSEPRDGKHTLIVGNKDAEDIKEVAAMTEFTGYGWFSDNYVLASKNGSELFILPASGVTEAAPGLKITDYHKPDVSFPGYGYGYGGQ